MSLSNPLHAALAALIASTSFAAVAAGAAYDNKIQLCTAKGSIFMNAAEMRGLGRPPQDARDAARGFESTGKFAISQDYIKRAINLVYFDPGFANAGGMPLQQQVMNDCMRDGRPKFQPLR